MITLRYFAKLKFIRFLSFLFILSILFLLFTSFSFAVNSSNNLINDSIYISEIDFGVEEFIEIYSNKNLNLSDNKVYDENLNRFNTLSLIQEKDSPFYLIIGSKFIEKYNISKFNCSIYLTDKTQVSNGGLKSSGEDLTININSSLNLTYIHKNDLIFDLNQSLNYDINTLKYYIANFSICNYNLENLNIENIIDENENSFLNNSSLINSSLNFSNLTFFEVNISEFLVFDKVSFSFTTNVSNFSIKYWIEDYLGNIVKKPITTLNLNPKTWTPKGKTNIFYVKAILNYDKNDTIIHVNSSKMFYYYSNQTYLEPIIDEKLIAEKENSKFIITNSYELQNQKTTIVSYDIYKGNTLKRAVYFYLNGKKISTLTLSKYTSLSGNLDLKNYLTQGKNIFLISGLDLEEEIIFMNNNVFYGGLKAKEGLNSNNNLYIENILTENSLIYFNLYSNLEDNNLNCYILLDKTKVSNEINFNLEKKKYNLNLKINKENLEKKNFENGKFLKLICKYNQSNSIKYLTEEFNFFLNENEISNQNLNYNFNSGKINFFSNSNINNSDKQILTNKSFLNNFMGDKFGYNKIISNNNSIEIISKNLQTKEKSRILFLIVLIMIICILILRW